MCGIVGLHLRNPELYEQLGSLLTDMLIEMEDRGADSAGVALYGDSARVPDGHACVSLADDVDTSALKRRLESELDTEIAITTVADTTLVTADIDSETLHAAVRDAAPAALVAGFGEDLQVLKGVGRPTDLAKSWGLSGATGWQGVGHTRMATESAVTAAGCHPYAVGPSECLVHNGSFHNYATIRRELTAAGVTFDSENDTEVGARYVAAQLADGKTIEKSLEDLNEVFDGFYTLLVSNHDSFAVLRDSIACKPAVIAETADWVAMASEYRALAGLPGIETARIWEPEPEVVYAWTR